MYSSIPSYHFVLILLFGLIFSSCKFGQNSAKLESASSTRKNLLVERDLESIPSPAIYKVSKKQTSKSVFGVDTKYIDLVAQENILLKVKKKELLDGLGTGKNLRSVEKILNRGGNLSGIQFQNLLVSVKEPKLGPLADCREEPMTIEHLKSVANQSSSKMQFLKKLNKDFPNSLQNMTVLHKSNSIVEKSISPKNPRLIRFSLLGDLFLSWTCAEDKFEEVLEVMSYDDESDKYVLHKIDFEKEKKIQDNPSECLLCHSSDLVDINVVGIWDRYPVWPGAYGGSDDGLSDNEFLENHKQQFLDFKKRRKSNECIAQLPWESEDAHDFYKLYPFHEVAKSKPNNYYVRPNLKINDALLRRTAKMIARAIRETNAWKEIEPLVIESLVGCSEAKDVDQLLQSVYSDYKDWSRNSYDVNDAYSDSSRYGEEGLSGTGVANYDPRIQSSESKLLYNLSISAGLTNRHWNPSPNRFASHFIAGIASQYSQDDLTIADIVKAQLLEMSLDNTGSIWESIRKGNGTERAFGPDFQCLDEKLVAETFVPSGSQRKVCALFHEYYEGDERLELSAKRARTGFSPAVQSYTARLSALDAVPEDQKLVSEGRQFFKSNCTSCHNSGDRKAPEGLLFATDTNDNDSYNDAFTGKWLDNNLGGEAYLLDSLMEGRMPPNRPIKSKEKQRAFASYIEMIGAKRWKKRIEYPRSRTDTKRTPSKVCGSDRFRSTCTDNVLRIND